MSTRFFEGYTELSREEIDALMPFDYSNGKDINYYWWDFLSALNIHWSTGYSPESDDKTTICIGGSPKVINYPYKNFGSLYQTYLDIYFRFIKDGDYNLCYAYIRDEEEVQKRLKSYVENCNSVNVELNSLNSKFNRLNEEAEFLNRQNNELMLENNKLKFLLAAQSKDLTPLRTIWADQVAWFKAHEWRTDTKLGHCVYKNLDLEYVQHKIIENLETSLNVCGGAVVEELKCASFYNKEIFDLVEKAEDLESLSRIHTIYNYHFVNGESLPNLVLEYLRLKIKLLVVKNMDRYA